MKMKKIWIALLLAGMSFGMGSCMKEDIDDLRKELQEHDDRLTSLEEWQKSVNTSISSLQSLVEALEDKDYVTGVTPLADGSGYEISFLKSGTITIKHGEKGDTPVISVKQDTDGKYYWTVNGEWLLDSDNNKMPVTGEKGEQGDPGTSAIAPQVRINPTSNEWEISTDGGTNWNSTGIKATGDKGEQGDAVFAKDGIDNTHDEYVEFTLADGTTFRVPKYAAAFSIAFENDEVFYASPASNELTLILPASLKESDYRSITATVTAAEGADVQTRSSNNKWTIAVTKPSFNADGTLIANSAKVSITGTEDTRLADTYLLHVALTATDGTEVTASKLVKYFDGQIVKNQNEITNIAIKKIAWVGSITDNDMKFMNGRMSSLEVIDLSMAETTEIGKEVFWGLSTLHKIWLPTTVKTIGEAAFAYCYSLSEIDLVNVEIISQAAFLNCTGLQYIDIPASVKTLGRWIFEDCPNLTTVKLHEGLTSLSASTFYKCGITNITIPSTVKEIPDWCFESCKNLERIYLHDGITSVGQGAFMYCYSLESFTAPKSLTVLGDDAFYDCKNLSLVLLHDNIESIGASAFYGCESLRKLITHEESTGEDVIRWPKALAAIGAYAFASSALEEVYIKDSPVTAIPQEAFRDCKNLTKVTLSDALQTIGTSAFYNTPITQIIIPANVTNIGDLAFWSCKSLTRVDSKNTTAPALGSNAFAQECKTQCQLVYPSSGTGYDNDWTKYFKNSTPM